MAGPAQRRSGPQSQATLRTRIDPSVDKIHEIK